MMNLWKFRFVAMALIAILVMGCFSYSEAENPIEEKKDEVIKIEKEIEINKKMINQRRDDEFSYQNHLGTLESKLTKNEREQTFFRESIELVKLQITDKEEDIKETKNELNHQQNLLGSYLRDINHYDDTNKMLLLFESDNLSDFYNQVNFTENISDRTYDLVQGIETDKKDLEEDRKGLVNKKLEQGSMLSDLQLKERELAMAQEELEIMRQLNAEEVNSLEDANAETAVVRDKLKQDLFAMTREGTSVNFQDAAKYAFFAAEKTGIRPELIMSIIKQETNFGNNVGNGTYKSDMNSSQHATFVQICLELGRSPESTPVSAKPKSYQGWGGAMGPSQFMPTTWMTVKEEVSRITGNIPADPWDMQDAFVATGVKLAQMGAASQNRDTEWEAAGRYFAGGNYAKYPWYGDNVMRRADIYKEQLRAIN